MLVSNHMAGCPVLLPTRDADHYSPLLLRGLSLEEYWIVDTWLDPLHGPTTAFSVISREPANSPAGEMKRNGKKRHDAMEMVF